MKKILIVFLVVMIGLFSCEKQVIKTVYIDNPDEIGINMMKVKPRVNYNEWVEDVMTTTYSPTVVILISSICDDYDVNNNIEINWGDNIINSIPYLTAKDDIILKHTYSKEDSYVITLTANNENNTKVIKLRVNIVIEEICGFDMVVVGIMKLGDCKVVTMNIYYDCEINDVDAATLYFNNGTYCDVHARYNYNASHLDLQGLYCVNGDYNLRLVTTKGNLTKTVEIPITISGLNKIEDLK